MLPDVKPDEIRNEPKNSKVERQLADCALRFALLGDVQTARRLAELIFDNGFFLGSWILHGALKFAWDATGQWPEGWPSKRCEIPTEDEYQANRNASWVGLPGDRNRESRAMLDACLGVEDNAHANARTGSAAMYKGQRLIRALEISVKLHHIDPEATSIGETRASKKTKDQDGGAMEKPESGEQFKVADLDRESANILNKIVPRLHANQQIDYLGEAKRLWPFYVKGLMADAMDLSRAEIEDKGRALLEAFTERYERVYVPSPLAGKSIKELLDMGNKNTIDHFVSEKHDLEEPKTLFKTPATDEEIEKLEERLETVLPDDYKEFLKISNGFGRDIEGGIFNGYFTDPDLHEAESVDWIEEEYFQLPVDVLELPREYEELIGMEHKQSHPDGDFDWDTAFPLFDRVLEVGVQDIDNLWLVHPGLVEQVREQYHKMYVNANEKQKKVIVRAMAAFAGSKEAFESMHWCFAKWSSGGSAIMTFYPSLTRYLEDVVESSKKNSYEGP